jgi:hypothetical protein
MSTNQKPDGNDELAYDRILESLGGDVSLLDTLGKIYQEDYPALIDEMEVAFNSSNAPALRSSTHKLRGLVSNFHDNQLVETLGALEKLASAGNLAPATNPFPAIKQRCEWLSNALTAATRKT